MEQQTPGLVNFLPLILVFVLFYFLLIKPQQKKAKEQKDMINGLSIGDEIILSSGLIGEIDEIPAEKNYVFVRFNSKDNPVRVFKDAIQDKYEEKVEVKQKDKNKKEKKNK